MNVVRRTSARTACCAWIQKREIDIGPVCEIVTEGPHRIPDEVTVLSLVDQQRLKPPIPMCSGTDHPAGGASS